MAELRSVDPKSLIPNPRNPRQTAVPKALDDQLVASIRAVGIIQPPRVKAVDDTLVVIAGNRRAKAAVAAGLAAIDVLVCDAEEEADAMRAVSENLIRASMNSVDIWRATETLEGQGWTEQAIADALSLPLRTIQRLKLLAHLHPPMLDAMARGDMPNDTDLRTIAAASRDEQAQVWKRHKPKKGQPVVWWDVSRGLSKRRLPFSAAKFGPDLATAYGVTWLDDLFAPAGEDARYTTDVDGFFGAQQEWMQNSLPPNATVLPVNEYGRPQLPKKAQPVYGKPSKTDTIGYHLDPRTGEVEEVAYRMPAKEPAKSGASAPEDGIAFETMRKPSRPEITARGTAMIGQFRTQALHQALREAEIDDATLIGLLILALGATNLQVDSPLPISHVERRSIASSLTGGGSLTRDRTTLDEAARSMLAAVLSCEVNASNSGTVARVAGEAIHAGLNLPNMAVEEFLSCLSKAGIERVALAEGVRVEVRGKDTRARMVERFKNDVYVHPAAVFALADEEIPATQEGADDSHPLEALDDPEPPIEAPDDHTVVPFADAAD